MHLKHGARFELLLYSKDRPFLALAPTLGSVEALYRKLERESYRAWHARDAIHKADHFFNFCVTAHSLRDYLLERLRKITPRERRPYQAAWDDQPLLLAVADIANSAKHFVLRERHTRAARVPATRRVRQRKGSVMDVYSNAAGELRLVPATAPDVSITLSSGKRHDLHTFMTDVKQYWREHLRSHGVHLRRQSFARLSGGA